MRTRISEWLGRKLAAELGVLFGLRDAPLGGPARGLAFQLAENLGSLPRRAVQPLLAALSADNRTALAKLGVRIGMETVYIPSLLKPAPVRLRALLWSVHRNNPNVPPLAEGRVSMPIEPGAPPAYYEACGFRVIAGRAIRVDMLDRFAVRLSRLARSGDFAATPELLSLLGVSAANAIPIIVALGYRSTTEAEGATKFVRAERRREHRHDKRAGRRREVATDSPFAALGRLKRS
jgi:ATP-dependent RNA helicase SUPV3L1/SUV3